MYEVVWDTTGFNNKAEWPADGSQPFVLSTGDSTGLGQHGDYVFGWKDDSLQRAMDTAGCFGAQCASLKTQNIEAAKACAVKRSAKEDYDKCEYQVTLDPGCALCCARGSVLTRDFLQGSTSSRA